MGGWIKGHWGRILLVTLVAGAGVWWLWSGKQGARQEVPPVKADNRVLAEGIVFPVRYAQMVMPVDGMIGEILVREGENVAVGQPLLRLVRSDAQARVGNAASNVARAAASLEQARVNLLDAERELERQQQLAAVGAAARQQLDQARTVAERNRALVRQAQAELQVQEAVLAENSGLLDKTELRAPMAGKIVYLDVKVGEHATLGTVLVRIADERDWEIRSDDLTELVVAKVRIGDPVALTFDGIPELEIPGRVAFIRPYGEKKRGDITYTVTVAPERWDERLRWNMTAQLAIIPGGGR